MVKFMYLNLNKRIKAKVKIGAHQIVVVIECAVEINGHMVETSWMMGIMLEEDLNGWTDFGSHPQNMKESGRRIYYMCHATMIPIFRVCCE